MIATELLIRCSCALLGLWGVLHALQWFADLRHWRDGSALGWDLQRLRKSRALRSSTVAVIYGDSGLPVLIAGLLMASLGLLVLPLMLLTLALLAVFLLAVLALAQRSFADGADKMAMAVASGALLQNMGLAVGSDQLVLAGCLWTGGQLTLAYFAAGASKLLLAGWQNGTVPRQALRSYAWGQPWTAALVSKTGASLVLGWLIMGSETLFPLALFAPAPVLYVALAGMFLLHLTIAAVMGLNTYPWAFLAAYPSVLFLGQWLATTLSR